MEEKFEVLGEEHIPQMAELFARAFGGEPWNDDWSDRRQLDEYMRDIACSRNPLNFGLFVGGRLAALSVGSIRHWWEGTNYVVEELCVSPDLQGRGVGTRFMGMIEEDVARRGLAGIFLQTDSDKPALGFYRRNGFRLLNAHVSLFKGVGGAWEVEFGRATEADIPELVRLRIAYMEDDFGGVSASERESMERQLPDYFSRKLGTELVAFVARAGGRIVSAAYLHVIEMPANSILLNGLYGEVLSVFTEPEYRGRGICTRLMRDLVEYGRGRGLGRIDLSATKEGYPIYKKIGFEDKERRYTDMRLKF